MSFSKISDHDLPSNDPAFNYGWRSYYAKRRVALLRAAQAASGVGIAALMLKTAPAFIKARYPVAFALVGLIGTASMLIIVLQWLTFNWVLGRWTCPRCHERFFLSLLVFNPFGRYCRHCKLRRPTCSEIAQIANA